MAENMARKPKHPEISPGTAKLMLELAVKDHLRLITIYNNKINIVRGKVVPLTDDVVAHYETAIEQAAIRRARYETAVKWYQQYGTRLERNALR